MGLSRAEKVSPGQGQQTGGTQYGQHDEPSRYLGKREGQPQGSGTREPNQALKAWAGLSAPSVLFTILSEMQITQGNKENLSLQGCPCGV